MVSSDDPVDFDSASTDDVDRLFRGSCVSQNLTYDDDEWEASIATVRTGSGSRFSCLGPDFLAIFYSSALFAFSDNSPLRHLSDRFSSVMSTLLECTGSFDETPAAFSRVIPSTKTLPVEYSTRSTFPSSPANSPRIMRTLSPVLSGTRLILCLPVRSFESRA